MAPITDDALFDFVCLANAYRSISLENRDLYRVAMASGRLSISGESPTGISEMFDHCANALSRCIQEGSIVAADARAALMVFWTGVHGQGTLEFEQVFPTAKAGDAAWETCFRALLIGSGAARAKVDQVFRRSISAPAKLGDSEPQPLGRVRKRARSISATGSL